MAAAKKHAPEKGLDQPAAKQLRDADQTGNAGPGDAELNDPPVRTDRPDVPVLVSLAVGAGQHELDAS